MAHVTLERSPAHCDEVAANLWDLTKDEVGTNFAISVGTTRLPCHRVVLAANSPMLRETIALVKPQCKTFLIPSRFSVAAMEVVLQYMYMSKVTIESRLLKDLLQAADYLQMRVLKQQCIDLIQGNINITPENVVSWCPVALQFDLHDITAQCSHIAATSFSEVIQTEEFLALGVIELNEYLDQVREEVFEDSLLEATMAWASHNVEERADYLEEMVEFHVIKLEDCSQEVLRQQTDLHAELLDVSPEVLTLLLKASVAANRLQSNIKQTKKHRSLRKKISERLVVIGGSNVNGVNRDCWYLDLKTHRMTKFTEIPADCCCRFHSVCKTPYGFVVTGGENSDICAKYITATGSWVRLQCMPVNRQGHGSIWINGKLYAIGGCAWCKDRYDSTSRVDYLGTDGIWHEGPALSSGNMSMPLVASLDIYNIYVLAPHSGRLFVLDLSNTFSPGWKDWFWSAWKRQASWKRLASMPKGWCSWDQCSMTAMNDRLYVCSKYIFSYYSPVSNTWCIANTPIQIHFYSPLVHYDGKLYLMGSAYEGQCNEVEEYDPETQTWTKTGFRFNKVLLYHDGMVLSMPE